MTDSLGLRLRQRRERQRISLTTIAEQTKIQRSLLEGLERNDISRWPAGIFRRAFIRAYAHAIGLEPEVLVREFMEVHPDPIELAATASATTPCLDRPATSVEAPTRLRSLVSSVIDSLAKLRRE